jgi:hypothetical protein
MQQEHHVSPLLVTLQGSVLDGDSFELLPQGSVLPPLRLSYAYRDKFLVVARFGVPPPMQQPWKSMPVGYITSVNGCPA